MRIPFSGTLSRAIDTVNGVEIERTVWKYSILILAVAFDTPITGYNTFNTNNLRLWAATPVWDNPNQSTEYFGSEDYVNRVLKRLSQERISDILLEKGNFNANDEYYETLIMQQYFFTSASLKDIKRRFKKKNMDFVAFAEKNAI